MSRLSHCLQRHSRGVNIVTAVLLLLISLLCYILILILYISPQSYHLSSFLTPSSTVLKPTIAVQVVADLLGFCVATLVTLCVEQHLWIRLSPGDDNQLLTVAESRRLAQWSVSKRGQFTYIFSGALWLLKLGGITLLGIASVVPVLLWGISPGEEPSQTTSFQPSQQDAWSGWITTANAGYNGGNYADVPGVVAALAYLSGLSPPPSSLCSTTNLNCSVRANSTSIQAGCAFSESAFPTPLGNIQGNSMTFSFCSQKNRQLCTTLRQGSPCTYANFTSGFPAGCNSVGNACTPGDFAVIFGAFVNATNTTGPYFVNTVDCSLSYGTVTINQGNQDTPNISAGSFEKSSNTSMASIVDLHRLYTEGPARSPYSFDASSCTGDQADSLYNTPLATMLLTPKADSSAEEVANRIERIFNMATLLAFSRAPNASELTITTSKTSPVWVYNEDALAILLVPFMATILGTWTRWKIKGKDVVPQYDPVAIARRGPVEGFEASVPDGDDQNEKKLVVGYEEGMERSTGVRYRLRVTPN